MKSLGDNGEDKDLPPHVLSADGGGGHREECGFVSLGPEFKECRDEEDGEIDLDEKTIATSLTYRLPSTQRLSWIGKSLQTLSKRGGACDIRRDRWCTAMCGGVVVNRWYRGVWDHQSATETTTASHLRHNLRLTRRQSKNDVACIQWSTHLLSIFCWVTSNHAFIR